MKKISGILGIVIVALAMFINTTNINIDSVSDITLASLIELPTANAEDCYEAFIRCDDEYPHDYNLFMACMFGAGC
jgi:hypothetical protein